jgi:coenzyme F420-reducing hydrogenase gamma subunit
MDVKVFQFNGCNKCFNEALLLKLESGTTIEYIDNPKSWKTEKTNIAVITGYLLLEDSKTLEKIAKKSDKVIGYGNCAAMGGVFALANQNGHKVTPLQKFVSNTVNVNGCLGEIEELITEIKGEKLPALKPLCTVCKRKSTCDYMEVVKRQIEIDDSGTCFNDLGFQCNGFIATECKERCIDYNAPCRGCKPMIARSGIRMLGMFGTLMGNIEVATEHSVKGATDKLADEDDDVTRSLPDVLGNFFRFTLPTSGLPQGRIPSSGTVLEDVFIGRLIEELPLISGLLGGNKSISLTLKILEAYETVNKIEVSDPTKKFRKDLKKLEGDLVKAIDTQDAKKYREISVKIRKIAGNMNLSNVFFGGFRSKIEDNDNFDDYKTHPFDVVEGTYKKGAIEFKLDSDGKVNEFKIKEESL